MLQCSVLHKMLPWLYFSSPDLVSSSSPSWTSAIIVILISSFKQFFGILMLLVFIVCRFEFGTTGKACPIGKKCTKDSSKRHCTCCECHIKLVFAYRSVLFFVIDLPRGNIYRICYIENKLLD